MIQTRPDREEILVWCRLNPHATASELAQRYRLPMSTAVRYVRKAKEPEEPKAPKAPRPPVNAPPPRGAPAKRMTEDDREGVVATVRDTYAILRGAVGRLRKQLDNGDELKLDRDLAQAMLSLQRMAAGLIEMHPGLLELVQATEGDEVTDADLQAMLEVLGVV